MAIQVNGTQVIGNSRELTNIASVDATTAAAIGAAGVGGGSNTFTAAQSVSAGVPVGLNSSGQIIPALAANTTVLSENLDDASNDQMITTWYDAEDVFITGLSSVSGQRLYAFKDAEDGLNGIDVSPRLSLSGARPGITVSYDTTNDRVLVSRVNANASDTVRHSTIASIDSASLAITLNSDVSYGGTAQSNTSMNSVFVTPQSRHLVTYYNSSNQMIIACISTSSSTPSGQSTTVVNSGAGRGKSKLSYLSNSQFLATWVTGSNQYLYGAIGSLSGSTITMGSQQLIVTGPGAGHQQTSESAYDPVSGKTVFVYTTESNSYKPYGKVGTVSGNSISFGSDVDLAALGVASGTNYRGVSLINDGSQLFLLDMSRKLWLVTVSGTSISLSAVSGTLSPPAKYMSYNVSPYVVMGAASNGVSIGHSFKDASGNNYHQIVKTTTGGGFIGVTEESISSGSSGSVTTVGGINEQVSGLTPGASYNINLKNSLAESAYGGLSNVGRALSATKLLITGGA